MTRSSGNWRARPMQLEQLTHYLPLAAIALGVILLAASQRERLTSILSKWRSALPASTPQAEPKLVPAERFEMVYALRTWCLGAGHSEAVEALDGQVLPAIVQTGGPQP